jgi:hypothetical protein
MNKYPIMQENKMNEETIIKQFEIITITHQILYNNNENLIKVEYTNYNVQTVQRNI